MEKVVQKYKYDFQTMRFVCWDIHKHQKTFRLIYV